jgi:hypothetical protein
MTGSGSATPGAEARFLLTFSAVEAADPTGRSGTSVFSHRTYDGSVNGALLSVFMPIHWRGEDALDHRESSLFLRTLPDDRTRASGPL